MDKARSPSLAGSRGAHRRHRGAPPGNGPGRRSGKGGAPPSAGGAQPHGSDAGVPHASMISRPPLSGPGRGLDAGTPGVVSVERMDEEIEDVVDNVAANPWTSWLAVGIALVAAVALALILAF